MTAVKSQLERILETTIRNKALSIDRLYLEVLENSKLEKSKYDIVSCDMPWFGHLAENGVLTPLNEFLRSDPLDISDFYPAAVHSARWKGVQYGIPIQTAPEMLVCRRDLFEEAGIAFPETVDELLDAARQLHSPQCGLSGITWNAASGTPLGHSFMMMMAAFGQAIINLRRISEGFDCSEVSGEAYRPMLSSEAARLTAEYMLELLRYSPSSILGMSWYERAKAYAQGECAMSYCYSLLASIFENDEKSPARGKSVYLPHPRGPKGEQVAPLGGYALAIPDNIDPARKAAIWTALKTLVSAEATKQYVIHGSTSSPRYSVAGDPEVHDLCPLIGIVDQAARLGQVQYWPRPPIPEMPEVISIIGTELYPMLRGNVDARTALTAAQNRIDAMMRARGHY